MKLLETSNLVYEFAYLGGVRFISFLKVHFKMLAGLKIHENSQCGNGSFFAHEVRHAQCEKVAKDQRVTPHHISQSKQ